MDMHSLESGWSRAAGWNDDCDYGKLPGLSVTYQACEVEVEAETVQQPGHALFDVAAEPGSSMERLFTRYRLEPCRR